MEADTPRIKAMSNETAHSLNTDTEMLLDALQNQAAAGHVQLETIAQLRQALSEAERRRGELAKREQAARAKADAARAEAAATRTKAEAALKALAESEQRYRIMGETIPFGVWWCNPQGGAEYVSPSFLELLNMTLEEQSEFGWTRRLVPEDVEPMMNHWMHCIQTGEFWEHEHRIIDRHGKINTVLSVGRPVQDEQGKIIAWVGVNLDHTERKRIEVELKQAKEALEEAMRAKDQFLANISHELRTPLTLILGPVRKMLSAENLTEEQRRDLAVIERNARTLHRNVNDLLDLSKLDAGRMRINYVATDVAWLSRFVASHFESVADEKAIHLSVQTPKSLRGQVDPEKLQRVLFNLLSNAFKFTPAQGLVRFGLHAAHGTAVFTVEDTGPGIPPEMRQVIFERFRQLDSGSTRRHGGTGLGLAIVKEFVNLHRGSVAVNEAAGGGTRLTVEIPLAAPEGADVQSAAPIADEEAAAEAVAELRTQMGLAARSGPPLAQDAPLVLVVEDNPEMNTFIAESLGQRYRVSSAMDGQEGLEKTLRERPELIVSDIMMPRMSGEELVREIRRHRELDDVPVLLLTAKADEKVRIELLRNGAQDCLVKPFVTEELLARADGLIARKRKAEASLRESYALLRAVTEGVNDAVFVKDAQGRYRMSNTAGARRLGRCIDEVVGHDDLELFGPEVAAQIRSADEKVMAEGQTLTFEETRTVGGTERTYLTTKGPHRDHRGQLIGVLGISRDITERKQAEVEREKLLEEVDVQRARLQAILDSLPVGVWITDATGRMVLVNDIARDIWGGRAPQAENVEGYQEYRAWWAETGNLITAEDMPLARAIRGETLKDKIIDFERFDGTGGTQLLSAAPVRDREGTIIGGVAVVQDITTLKQTEAALRESEERFRAFMDNSPTIAWAKDAQGRHVYLNKAYERRFGVRLDDWRGKTDFELWPREVAETFRQNDLAVLSGGKVVEAVEETPDCDGTPCYWWNFKFPFQDVAGTRYVGGVGLDITDRKRAEEALRESEERFRALVMATSETLYRMSPDWTEMRQLHSRGFLANTEKPNSSWLQQYIHPADQPQVIAAIQNAIRTTSVFETEHQVLRADGSLGWTLSRAVPLMDARGEILEWFGAASDITEQRRAEEAMRRSEERLRLALEAARLGTFDFDVATGEVVWDQQMRQIWGLDPEDPLDYAEVLRRVHPEDQERVSRIFAEALESHSDGRYTADYRIVWPDGAVHWTRSWGLVYFTGEGPGRRAVRVLGVEQDVTPQVRATQELQRLKDELEVRVEQRTADLAAANRDLEAFAYTVSHDLRAPLRHVTAFVELLDQHSGQALDEQGREYLRTISSAAQRMGNLMDDLLRLSRLGRAALTDTDVSLRQLVDEALEELAPQTEGRRIDWQVGALPRVRGDHALLRGAVVNLLANAVKYTRQRDPAKIEVGCQERDNEVVFFVRDNGAGFDMEFADKLFGVFQRLHPAQEFEGTGVGLASVRRVIERHGGRTWAEGAVNRGTTFFFSLPVKR